MHILSTGSAGMIGRKLTGACGINEGPPSILSSLAQASLHRP
jgi:hypothetical protein